jgi:hypothetical protein
MVFFKQMIEESMNGSERVKLSVQYLSAGSILVFSSYMLDIRGL